MKDFDILYIAACEKQSTTITKARSVAEDLMKNNEDVRIEIIDSLNASIGQGLVVVKACEFRDEGLTLDEVIEKTMDVRKHIVQFVTVDTMTYLSKANKINARTASMADLLGLHPILSTDKDGNQVGVKSIRGKNKGLHIDEVVKLFFQNVESPETQDVTIIHGDDKEKANYVKDLLKKNGFKARKINIFCVGPVVGITTGPGMIGIFGFGRDINSRIL